MNIILTNGMMVTLKQQYHNKENEVFKLSQVEDESNEQRAFAGDIDGKGWYVRSHQIEMILGQNEDVVEVCDECNGACFVPSNIDDGQHTIWIVCPECNGDGGFIDDEYGYEEQVNFD